MKKFMSFGAKVGIILSFLSASFLPSLVFAQEAPINPYDEDVAQFLEMLEIELSPTESIWSDPTFVEFMNDYKELMSKSDELVDLLADVTLGFLDLVEKGDSIADARFQEIMELSDGDREELQNVRTDITEELDDLKNDEMGFIEFFLLGMMTDGLDDFNDDYDDNEFYDDYDFEESLWVDAYTETYEAVEAGNIIFMEANVFQAVGDVIYTWEQTYGPDVTNFLSTEGEGTMAFIIPEYDLLGDDTYIEFIVTVVDEAGNEDYNYVWADLIMG
jgi:hypothetical protein